MSPVHADAHGRGSPFLLATVIAALIVPLACGTGPGSPSPATPGATPTAPTPIASPSAQPSASAAPSAAPSASTAPSASPSPTPGETWLPLGDLPVTPPVATLTATVTRDGFIGAASAFQLVSISGEPAAAIAARLTTDPTIRFTVVPSDDPARVTLRPAATLPAGALLHVRVAAADGTPAATWAYQVDQPPRVVATVPGDRVTDVPISTGIEVLVDQDGFVAAERDFVIQPKVTGHVEIHGRAITFVPDRLQPGTLYTVTLKAGLARPGSDQRMADDVTWRFETAAAATDPRAEAWVASHLVNASPAERAVLAINRDQPEWIARLTKATLAVHRLAGRGAAIDAARALVNLPDWSSGGRYLALPTASLRLVSSTTVTILSGQQGTDFVRLPRALPAGWYLASLTAGGRTSQAVIQVTTLATYLAVTTTRTLAWVNDLAAHGPLAGVRVSVAGGAVLGRTGADGILVATTPPTLRILGSDGKGDVPPGVARVLLLDAPGGRGAYVILTDRFDWAMPNGRYGDSSKPSTWWSALSTDRVQYHTTDGVSVWGYLRDRASSKVPASVEVILAASETDPPIARATTTPDRRGAFAVTLPVRDIPTGGYEVMVQVGGKTVDSTWIEIATIRKPLYSLEATLDHHAAIEGASVTLTATARFYDGTPAAGVALVVAPEDGDAENGDETSATTGADGTVRVRVAPHFANDQSGPDQWSVAVRAGSAEEGQIEASAALLLFRADELLDASGSVAGRRLVVSGAVHVADLARLDRLPTLDAVWAADPRAAPVAGRRVVVEVTEITEVKTRVGTSYDPITKQTFPEYETHERRVALPAVSARTGTDGRYRVGVPIASGTHRYEIRVRAVDGSGRSYWVDAWATTAPYAWVPPLLSFRRPADPTTCPPTCTVGTRYAVDLVGRRALPAGGANRYLFLVEQQGLKSWTISSTPHRTAVFSASDAPDVIHDAVWFTGSGYVEAASQLEVNLDVRPRTLTVAIRPDRDRYAPGDEASVTIRVTDAGGRAVAASVVVAVVDEKLFAAAGGATPVSDPLELLYQPVGDGLIRTYASHVTPAEGAGGGGSTTGGGGEGGGDRSVFRDNLLFSVVATGADGTVRLPVHLSDDLTSWRVAAGAMTADLRAGVGLAKLPVGLPFFVDATIAPEYLVGDRPSIVARAFGSAVHADTNVTFTVSSTTLPMAATTVTGKASAGVTIPLPPLTPGIHRLRVEAVAGANRDALVRTFRVVVTRRTHLALEGWDVTERLSPDGGVGMSTYVISDAGRGRWVCRLLELATEPGTRADQRVVALAARAMLVSVYGLGPADLPPAPPDAEPFRVPEGGLSLVSYGSADLETTVRALLAAPELAGGPRTAGWLRAIAGDPGETPERRSVATAGLAALGEPVLAALRTRLAAADVTDREALWIGLGAVALGDETTARTVLDRIARSSGERQGLWVRIRVSGKADEVAEATARFAALAAAVGDPRAEPALAYVTAHPSTTDLEVAEEFATISGLVRHLPAIPTEAAWTVDGRRTTARLDDGRAVTLHLTPAQRPGLVIEAVKGRLSVVGSWEESGAPAAPATADLDLERSVTPEGTIGRSDIVRVTLRPTYGFAAPDGSYRVVDLAPSGLAPIERPDEWGVDPEFRAAIFPMTIDGQRVVFGTGKPLPGDQEWPLVYYARVVTPGTYAWEPTTLTSETVPDAWVATDATTVTIR